MITRWLVALLAGIASAWTTAFPARGATATPAKTFMALLNSPDLQARRHAAEMLGRLGDRSAVPRLIDVLDAPDPALRRAAARALGRLRDPRAAPALVRKLRDSDGNVRFAAAHALGLLHDSRASAALVECLRTDPEWCVRDQAAWALRELRNPGDAALLLHALTAAHADTSHISWVLAAYPPETLLPHLLPLLHAPDARSRRRAVALIASWKSNTGLPYLISALNDPDAPVRKTALQALAGTAPPTARSAVVKLAKSDPDPAIRQAAVEALARFRRADGLLAWWNFETILSGGKIPDASGGGNTGENIGCRPVPGKVGRALHFTPGHYVELGQPRNIPIAHHAFTIMAWAKPEAPTGVLAARGGAWCGFSLYLKNGIPGFGIHRRKDGPAFIAAATSKIGTGWVHLAGVVRRKRIELYVNGVRAATAKTPGFIPNNCGQGMEIGFDAANSPVGITDNFQGVIDEVKIFSKPMNAAQISKEMQDETAPAGGHAR